MFEFVKALVAKHGEDLSDYAVGQCLKQVARLVEAEMNFKIINGSIAAVENRTAPAYGGPKVVN